MNNHFNIRDMLKKGLVETSPGVWEKQVKFKGMKYGKKKKKSNFMLPVRVNVKPLSVNQAWAGRRFKTPKYKQFENEVMALLPDIELPAPPYSIYFKFGFSSRASDWDNCIKNSQDCISKRYKFDDKLIRRGEVVTEIVPKGKEYFIFSLSHIE